VRLALLTVLLLLAVAPAASAHAVLEATSPARGVSLEQAPR
jgi:methionine-rich copper-binding protein CopC